MNHVIKLDGISMKLERPDIDQDGQTNTPERITQDFGDGIQPIVQQTELGETLQELNLDSLEKMTRMSGIDMRSRLHPAELPHILALDALVGLQVLPTKCLAFTRQKKRLSVSIKGLGRKEIVDIVGGKKDQDAKSGMGGLGDRLKGSLGL